MVKIHILGTAQDGGLPHINCECINCINAFSNPKSRRNVASIAIVGKSETLLIDATPDITLQLMYLKASHHIEASVPITGIVITHLHMGHYVGLVQFGKEAGSTNGLPIFVTEKVGRFLAHNKPFQYLFERKQLTQKIIKFGEIIDFGDFTIYPIEVPHRNEDGDTLGLKIVGPKKSVIYIPDIDFIPDDLIQELISIDIILFDGTFYSKSEIPHQEYVPHPPIEDTMNKFRTYKGKFYFTHFNHSNPIIQEDSAQYKGFLNSNFLLANDNQIIDI